MRRVLYRILTPQRLRFTRATLRDLDEADVVVGTNAVWGLIPLALGLQEKAILQRVWEEIWPYCTPVFRRP